MAKKTQRGKRNGLWSTLKKAAHKVKTSMPSRWDRMTPKQRRSLALKAKIEPAIARMYATKPWAKLPPVLQSTYRNHLLLSSANPRGAEPERRWWNAYQKAYAAAGGWSGPATLRALKPYALELFQSGATARAAGIAAAREYKVHSSREMYKELAGENPKRRNVAAGFVDEDGQFHPLRASYDYDAKRAGEGSRARVPKPRKVRAPRARKPARKPVHTSARKRGKRNPDTQDQAAKLYRQFHGAPAKKFDEVIEVLGAEGVSPKVVEKIASMIPPEDCALLGQLVRLLVKTRGQGQYEIQFEANERPKLVSNPEGTELYFVGGDQDVTPILRQMGHHADEKGLIDLGVLHEIEYFTRKQMDGFRPVNYYHELGEETGERPRLMFNRDTKKLYLVGGAYKVKPEGIRN